MKKFISIWCAFFVLFSNTVFAENFQMETTAKSVLLMEQSTGKVLFENNADEKLPIASVTKVMTMLLIMEEIDRGNLKMDDMVYVSERAMSMGGSTMFLEAGEELSVYEMLKGISVASANDGCVAMAEHISGSEETFVNRMNERAKELGMENTNFINTNGLDIEGHYSSARDVAIMSRELLKHEKIFEFTTIWTDKMHDGKFDLSNTNKLIRFYPGANGLKTGSTSNAKCCISASAKRDDLGLIAVVLGAENSDDRFQSAKKLLDYGFSNYSVEKIVGSGEEICILPVKKGVVETVSVVAKNEYSVLLGKNEKDMVDREIILPKSIKAPIKEGDVIGEIKVIKNDEVIGEVELVAKTSVKKKSFTDYLGEIFSKLFGV